MSPVLGADENLNENGSASVPEHSAELLCGSRFSPTDCGDGFDFRADADQDIGSMVRGVIAIRIDPISADVEEFAYMNGGRAYIDAGQLIIYGHSVR